MSEFLVKRLFIGGLSGDVTKEDLVERFSRFGKVDNVKLTNRTDDKGLPIKCFAHLDLLGDQVKLKKCFDTYQNTKWKGSVLKLQYAKESFLDKLKKEREEENNADNNVAAVTAQPPSALSEFKGSAVPGTPLPGKTDWVIGKYGRALPIMKLKKSYKLKTIKHDPSKYCHAAKVFKEDANDSSMDVSCDKLTWELDTPDTEITKKRRGEFPHTPSTKKVKTIPLDKTISNASKLKSFTQTEFVVVKQNFKPETARTGTVTASNRFDSDIESDAEIKAEHLTNLHKSLVSIAEANKKNKAPPSTRKIPEFQGLQMLSMPLNAACNNDTIKQTESQITEKTKTITSVFNSKDKQLKDESHFSTKKENTIQKITEMQKNCSHELPKFQGLSMLSPSSPIVKLSSPISLPSNTIKESLPNKANTETSPDKKRRQLLPKGTSSKMPNKGINEESSANDISCKMSPSKKSTEPKSHITNKQSSLHLLSSNLLSNGRKYDRDSISSADTDEIIAKCKLKCNMPAATETKKLSSNILANVIPSKSHIEAESHLCTSEYQKHSVLSSVFLKTNTSAADSDLDSNDFEAVIKILTEQMKSSPAIDESDLQGTHPPEKDSYKVDQSNLVEDNNYSETFLKDKKVIGNNRRLQALKETSKKKQQQQQLIQKALENVDTPGFASSQRTIFGSDSEDEVKNVKTSNKFSSDSKANTFSLFNSDSSESDEDLDEMFASKKHLEGKKGEKLMKMEQKFGDKRFKLNEKFVDSDFSDDEKEDSDTENVPSKDVELEEEKRNNIQILENIVGKTNLDRFSEKIKRNTVKIIDMNSVRFDPTKMLPKKEESVKQETTVSQKCKSLNIEKKEIASIQSPEKTEHMKTSEKKEKKLNGANASNTSVLPSTPITKKSKVHVDNSLVNLFKNTKDADESNTFSLLESFSSQDPEKKQATKSAKPLSGLLRDDKLALEIKSIKSNTVIVEKAVDKKDNDDDDNSENDMSADSDGYDKDIESSISDEVEDTSINDKLQEPCDTLKKNEDDTADEIIDPELLNAGRIDARFSKEQWLEQWEELRMKLAKIFKAKYKDGLKAKKFNNEKKKKEIWKNKKHWKHHKHFQH